MLAERLFMCSVFQAVY